MAFTDELFLYLIKCPLLAVSFELFIKFSQIFAVKYLLLIYYHLGDRFRAILALLFMFTIRLPFFREEHVFRPVTVHKRLLDTQDIYVYEVTLFTQLILLVRFSFNSVLIK